MKKVAIYAARRLATAAFTVLLVSLLIFIAFNLVPGDPVRLILGTEASEERVAALRALLGLDKSLPMQYLGWISGMLHGDFGTSIKYQRPVAELIGQRVPVTVTLAAFSLVLAFAFAIPLGILSARKKGSISDKAISFGSMLSISIPGFCLGIFVVWLFGLKLRLFMPGGYVSYRTNIPGYLNYMLFPAIVMALPNAAVALNYLRSSILEELKRNYVKTALSKGHTLKGALYKHVLKNAFVPLISLVGMMAASAFGGSIIIEQVFGIPGIGALLIGAITSRDFPMAQSMAACISVIVVGSNSAADIAIQIIDPRIKLYK
ncbi:MAG: ABC transporter permease [Clostridiales bacterium]|jgi:peptide/nickel transport system permease protein|nr:ABC transporter permease [Clostridiales bacterium]